MQKFVNYGCKKAHNIEPGQMKLDITFYTLEIIIGSF